MYPETINIAAIKMAAAQVQLALNALSSSNCPVIRMSKRGSLTATRCSGHEVCLRQDQGCCRWARTGGAHERVSRGAQERVSRRHKYLVVDGYRSEEEKANLLYWQVTCECFYTPDEWEWIFQQAGYTGDYACIYYN